MNGSYPGDTVRLGETREESRKILASSADARRGSFEMADIPSAVDVCSTRHYTFTAAQITMLKMP
jgi:hypothetical protein